MFSSSIVQESGNPPLFLGGDVNHCPILLDGEPEPDCQAVQPYNPSSRCLRRTSTDEPWRGDQIVGMTLRDGDLVDVAAYVAADRKDLGLLAPTGRPADVSDLSAQPR